MAKWNSSNVTLQGLKWLADNASKMIICKGQPANYAGAMATNTNKIATCAMTTATGTHYQITFGANNSAVLKVSSRSSMTAESSGGADHVALVSTAGSTLIYVTSLSATQVVSAPGNILTLTTWSITLKDAT